MRAIDRVLDLFRGKTVTIPPLDGAFKPNRALDEADVHAALPEPDDLVVLSDGAVLTASGDAVLSLGTGGAPAVVARFAAPVTALAALPQGGFVAGLATGALEARGGPMDGWTLPAGDGDALRGPTAIVAAAPDLLFVAQGSRRHAPADWAVDLMEGGATGSVWRIDLGSGTQRRVIDALRWPAGLLVEPDGGLVVSEAWRHRLLRVSAAAGDARPVLERLPGYPGRLAPAAGGGAWLALFAPRNRLVEFVLTQSHYREDMMARIDRRFWIAPTLRAGANFLEPLQSGGVVTMGVKKPWAPSRSYGLLARLGPDLQPKASLHSRADGTRHGVVAAVDRDGRLLVAAKGGDVVLALEAPGAAP